MSKSKSSLVGRLHGLFKNPVASSKPTKPLAAVDPAAATKSSRNKERKLEKLVEKFKKSSESGKFRRSHRSYLTTVRRLASAEKFSMIEDILEHQKKFEDITSENFVDRLILYYGYVGMFNNAQKLFDEMPQLQCERTVRSFNSLLSACVHAKKFDKVEEILRELPGKLGMKPDLVSFNTVIKAFCEMGDLDKAFSMLDELENNGVEPDIITFNTLLEGFYKNGRFPDGEKVWDLMESKNVIPNIRSYNSRLRGLLHDNRISEAVNLLDEMESKGIKPDVHSYNALIVKHCNDGNSEEAKRWYSELRKSCISPDTVTYVMLVRFLRQMGDLDMALELCREAINCGAAANPAVVQPMIDELVKESRTEDAKELVDLCQLKSSFRYSVNLPPEK